LWWADDVIVSFRDRRTEAVAARRRVKHLSDVAHAVRLALDRLEAAQALTDLAALRSNCFAPIDAMRCRIRVNDTWWIHFEWPRNARGPTNVEMVRRESPDIVPLAAPHPGEHLAAELRALRMSAAELARGLKVPTNRVTTIVNGQRAITSDTAVRLARFFGTSAEFWLQLQSAYELRRLSP
jgi:antitoxin HigA-1